MATSNTAGRARGREGGRRWQTRPVSVQASPHPCIRLPRPLPVLARAPSQLGSALTSLASLLHHQIPSWPYFSASPPAPTFRLLQQYHHSWPAVHTQVAQPKAVPCIPPEPAEPPEPRLGLLWSQSDWTHSGQGRSCGVFLGRRGASSRRGWSPTSHVTSVSPHLPGSLQQPLVSCAHLALSSCFSSLDGHPLYPQPIPIPGEAPASLPSSLFFVMVNFDAPKSNKINPTPVPRAVPSDGSVLSTAGGGDGAAGGGRSPGAIPGLGPSSR